MKILVIHNHYLEKGGEDSVVEEEIKLLERHGHKVVFYEKSNARISSFSFFKKLFFVLFELNFSLETYKDIKEIIKEEKPDLAHIHNIFLCISPSVYAALKEENIPVVQSLHNYRFFCFKGTFYDKGKVCEKCKNNRFHNGVIKRCWRKSFIFSYFLARLLYASKSFIKDIDSYIALSGFSRDKFIELGLDKEKIHLKPNFLAINPGEPGAEGGYALFVGRLVDYKGILTLIAACRINPSFNIKIIGDGPLNSQVRKTAASNANFQWLGRMGREDVLKEIKGCSFLIFPSECYENMPLAVMESFAFFKPVLASNLGAMRELVNNGNNGILFEPGNARDLSSKIAYLFSHREERLKMGERANKFFRERFDKEDNYNQLMRIYAQALNLKKAD